MVYLEYEQLKLQYRQSQRLYDSVISEKELLFAKTQPKSVQFDKDGVSGGKKGSVFDSYLIQKEAKRIDERQEEAKAILDGRKYLLEQKEAELRKSADIYDRLYVLKYLEQDRMPMQKICNILNYSDAHLYRLLSEIRLNILKMRENENLNVVK